MQDTDPKLLPKGKPMGLSLNYPPTLGLREWTDSKEPRPARPVDIILEAVRAGDLAQVTGLVASASYSPEDYLEKALCAAIRADQLDIGRYLLDHGAMLDKNVPPGRPWIYAVEHKSLPFIKLFVERGWDINSGDCGKTALFYALSNYELVKWLLAHGADPNLGPRDINHREDAPVSGSGHLLNWAAMLSTVEEFDELLAHGARLADSCALHHAALGELRPDSMRLMARLLELGVDIDEPDDKVDMQKPGRIGPPIFWAVRGAQVAKIKFLVEKGADLTIRNRYRNRTPVEEARRMANAEVKEYLESVSP